MSSVDEIKRQIKAPKARVFRRVSIKRRSLDTGLYEDDWYDITSFVKSYGKITNQIDSARRHKFTFGTAKLTVQNDEGEFNPADIPTSLWFGYLNQQRTLFKIEAGFIKTELDENGFWYVREIPSETNWDEAIFDDPEGDDVWDNIGTATVFMGILSGDIPLSDKNEVSLNLRPLVSVFQDFPARKLTGWTTTGMTASQFVEMVRDQQDAFGNYLFRPFFGDTTSNWEISTTSNVFAALNTSTATDVIDKTVWEVMEKLSEAENFVPFISREGIFKFISRTSTQSTTSFEFYGAGAFNNEYGHTIKSVNSFGFRLSKYYSRVQIKYREEDTSTSYQVREAEIEVSPTSAPWVLGSRTLSIENNFIQTATVANVLANAIFDDVSTTKREIEFSTTFVPHLEMFDKVSIFYDPADFLEENLWDLNDWAADDTSTANDLIFDLSDGDAIFLQGEEFKFISFEIDLDNLENRFIAREI